VDTTHFRNCPQMINRSRRPRIVHVITRLIVGGAQLSVVELCKGLRDEFDLRIVSGRQTGAEGSLHSRAAAAAPLTIIDALRREVSPRWDPVAIWALRRVLKDLDPDIVHTHSSKAGIVGRFAAAPLRAQVIHTIHGWGHTPADSALRRAAFIGLERAAARRSDVLVAVSEDTREEGLACRIGHSDIYRVIPDPVQLDALDPDFASGRARARETLGVDGDVEVIGWVGRFVDQKDPQTLSRVVADLLLRRPVSRAVLVGDGPRRPEVEAALYAAGVGDRVILTGVVDNARKLMPAFDVLVHPTLWEGQPVVVQEALAERIPVVSSGVSGIRELIQDGKTGFVVAPHASEAMADAVAAVLETPTLRAPLSDQLLNDLKDRHGRAVALERHRELYDALLNDGVDERVFGSDEASVV
jgi:glycosyltransferase involved in cell wall biosynthesis